MIQVIARSLLRVERLLALAVWKEALCGPPTAVNLEHTVLVRCLVQVELGRLTAMFARLRLPIVDSVDVTVRTDGVGKALVTTLYCARNSLRTGRSVSRYLNEGLFTDAFMLLLQSLPQSLICTICRLATVKDPWRWFIARVTFNGTLTNYVFEWLTLLRVSSLSIAKPPILDDIGSGAVVNPLSAAR